MKFKHSRKMFDGTSNRKILNCFYFILSYFAAHNDRHCHHIVTVLKSHALKERVKKYDTNAVMIVQQNDTCFDCSRKWHQWNVHLFSNTSFRERVEGKKNGKWEKIVMVFFCSKKMYKREPVTRD